MSYERRRPDRTDHRREAANRRRDRKPPQRAIEAATEALRTHDVPGTIRTAHAKNLKNGVRIPHTVGSRTVREIGITRGEPMHGAKRSDDHISSYTLALPIAQIDDDAVPGGVCPECGHDRGEYHYSAYHHISGHEAITCEQCEETLHSEDWG